MRPHITIAQLLVVMVPIAVGLAAVANPSAFWEGTVFVLTLLLLFAAILGVIYRTGADRGGAAETTDSSAMASGS